MSRAADLLHGHGEVLKLARLLGREPDELAYLEQFSPPALRELRDGVTRTLYDADGGSLQRLAAATRVLPAGLTATLGQRAFGPLLSARLAGMLEPGRAVDVAAKLPPPFLADVAVELDPRRASALIAGLSAGLIADVTAELVARREYVTMGRFVGHLHDEALIAAIGAMDDRALLEVAFVLEDRSQLTPLLSTLPRVRVAGIIGAAAREDLWLQALDLLNHLSKPQRRAMVKATLALGEPTRATIVRAIVDHDLWPEAALIAEHDDALPATLSDALRSLPARRRRAATEAARASGLQGV
jgi:hypothetical protein